MRCYRCDQADLVPVRRAGMLEKNGRVAVILAIPTNECPSCGERTYDWEVARVIDEMYRAMLSTEAEVTTRHFDETSAAA